MKNAGGIKLIFVSALALLIIAGTSAALSLSNSGGGSWSNYREITITNSGSALADYQVLVQLSGSSFPTTTSNGADIRFIDSNGNELSYWIENWDYAGKSGSIWVKVPNVPPSGNTIIKMYYGNTNAGGVSNGETTFDFFDDFLGMTLDTNKWTTGGYGIYEGVFYDISDSALNLWSDNSWRILRMNKIFSPPQKVVVETKFLKTAGNYWDQSFLVQNDATENNRLGFYDGGGANILTQQIIEGAVTFPTDFGVFNSNTWYISRIIKKSDTTIYIDAFNSTRRSINYYETTQPSWSTITWTWVSWQYNTTHVKFDWIYVHKYASPEPTIALGTEQPVLTPPTTGNISITSSPEGVEVFVDGASKGHTPVTVPNVSPGSHAVKCKLFGHEDYDTSTTVTAGSTSSVMCSLTPLGELSVKLSSEPESIQPGQISTIKITVTKDGAPVSGVNVMLSSTPSVKFIPLSGTTTINGEFISNFTASTEGDIKISALAKKEDINDGKGDIVVQVGKITPPPEKQATITGKVMDAGTDDPLQDVIITVDDKSAITGSDGEYELLVDVGKHNLSASKSGYETMTRSIIVPEVGNVFDLSLKPIIVWDKIIIILILIVAAAGIFYIFYKKKKQKEEPKTEGTKVEVPKVETKKLCMFCHAQLPHEAEFCLKCGKKQEEKTRFCMHCGAPMPHAPDLCPQCGKMPPSDVDTKTCSCGEVIPKVAKYCSNCGARQPE